MKLKTLLIISVSCAPLSLYAQTQLTQGNEVKKCYSVGQYADVSPAECIEQAARESNKTLKQAVDDKMRKINTYEPYAEPYSMEQGGENIKNVYGKAFRESQQLWEQSRDRLCTAIATPSGNATDSYNAGYMQCIINMDRRRLEELNMLPPFANH